MAGACEELIRLVSRIRFPSMKNGVQRVFWQGRKYHMYVIGHHAPGAELVALSLKVADGIGHNFRDARVAHITFAQSGVEALLGFLKDRAQFASAGLAGL